MCFCGLTSLNTNQGMEHQNLVYKCSLHHLLILANCLLISYHNKPSLQILFPQSRRPSSRLLGSVKYYYHFVKQFDNICLGLTILQCKITPAPEENDSPCLPSVPIPLSLIPILTRDWTRAPCPGNSKS